MDMDNVKMQTVQMTALEADEAVIWRGCSAPYRLLDAENKKSTMAFWITSIAVAVASTLVYTILTLNSGVAYQPVILIFTLGIPLVFFIDPVRDKKHLDHQLLVVTNHRVLIHHPNSGVGKEWIGLTMEGMDVVRIEDLEPGFSRIRFGSETFGAKNKDLRRKAMNGALDSEEHVTGLVFYHISDKDRDAICAALQGEKVTIEKAV